MSNEVRIFLLLLLRQFYAMSVCLARFLFDFGAMFKCLDERRASEKWLWGKQLTGLFKSTVI